MQEILISCVGSLPSIFITKDGNFNDFKEFILKYKGAIIGAIIAIIFILEKYFYFSANTTTLRILDLVVSINFGLAIFNLFPLPPLDGSRILAWILPTKLEEIYYKLEPFGIIILFIIIFTVGFGWIFVIAKNLKYFLYGLLGI